MDKLPMSLCMFVYNEEANLRDAIESVYPIVSEVVIVDGMSTDKTVEIAKKYTDRIYQVPFPDSFGMLRTITAHLAGNHWILMLDADERVLSSDWEKFLPLISQEFGTEESGGELGENTGEPIIDSWALPRKRWSDVWMTRQVDVESYPDWQVRLFRNHVMRRKIKFVRRVHERVEGCVRTERSIEGPVIHHMQGVNKTTEDLSRRQKMYERLYALDIADGVEHSEPPVIEQDKVIK